MLRIFEFLISGQWCSHRWNIIRQGLYSDGFKDGYYYDLQCEKCGNIRCKKI